VQRLQTVYDDCQRIYKKCREVGYEIHEEILRVLQELHTTMKTYHGYQLDCKEAEKKLRAAEVQRSKIQQTIPKEKLERNKKFKVIEKEVLKVSVCTSCSPPFALSIIKLSFPTAQEQIHRCTVQSLESQERVSALFGSLKHHDPQVFRRGFERSN
jgi:hypothetical protein